MVHRREVNGEPIVLGNHGALWGNAMTWFDHETGSVWSQPIGEAILGPLTGQRLELLPSTLTEWGDWKQAHPDSLALDAPSTRNGFDIDQMAVVVELGDDSVAHRASDLREVRVANSEVNGVPVAVVLPTDGDNWAVFSRRLDDRVVELELESGRGDNPVLAEIDGPGRWDAIRGLALGDPSNDNRNDSSNSNDNGTSNDRGAAAGQNLDRLPGFTSFPDDYVTFFPAGAFWQPDGTK
jgi:hypothetical protein